MLGVLLRASISTPAEGSWVLELHRGAADEGPLVVWLQKRRAVTEHCC